MGNKLGSNGLVALWNRIFNLIKLITGDVQVSTKGDLQTQINNIKTFTKSGSSAAGGLVPKPPTTAGTTKYICEDGTWKNIDEHTASFTSVDSKTSDKWTDVDALKSGEKHSSIFNKVSIMFKNIRFLYGLLGTTDISDLGDGTITNALSTLNSNLGKAFMYGGYTVSNGSHSITVPTQGTYLVIIQHAANNNNTAMYLVRKTNSSGYFAIVPNEHTSLTVNNIDADMDITITQDNSGSALVSLICLNSFSLFNILPYHDS